MSRYIFAQVCVRARVRAKLVRTMSAANVRHICQSSLMMHKPTGPLGSELDIMYIPAQEGGKGGEIQRSIRIRRTVDTARVQVLWHTFTYISPHMVFARTPSRPFPLII